MSVKSTQAITRQDAEEKYRWLMMRAHKPEASMTNTELEDELERLNDLVNGGEGFENYRIIWSNPFSRVDKGDGE